MTRESNLSECTFVFPPEAAGTDHRVRIFTRTAETPFAGHPTIGTAFALAHAGVLKPGTARTTFGLGVGPINLDLDWKDGRLALRVDDAVEADVRQDRHRRRGARGGAGRRRASTAARRRQEVNCGSNFFIVPLPTRKAVDAAVIDRAKVDAVFAAAGIQRRGIYAFSVERGGRRRHRLQPDAAVRRHRRSGDRIGRRPGRLLRGASTGSCRASASAR